MHLKFLFLLLSFATLLISSCAHLSPSQRAELEQDADLPVMCRAGKDCDTKWTRATQWVATHTTYPIRTYTSSNVITDLPSGMDDHAAFSLSREHDNADIDKIILKVTCNDWFGCKPSVLELNASFANTVTASPADPAKLTLGVRVHPVAAISVQAGGKQETHGVVAVVRVLHNSIGEKAGLHVGDLIIEYNGVPVTTEDELREVVANTPADQRINILIYRDRNTQTLISNK